MIETVGDILRELCTIGDGQDREIYIIYERRPTRQLAPRCGSVVSPFPSYEIKRRSVSLFQLRYRLMEAYRYECDEEPAKKLLALIVAAFRRERYATLFGLVAQAEDFLNRTSKPFNPTTESEAAI